MLKYYYKRLSLSKDILGIKLNQTKKVVKWTEWTIQMVYKLEPRSFSFVLIKKQHRFLPGIKKRVANWHFFSNLRPLTWVQDAWSIYVSAHPSQSTCYYADNSDTGTSSLHHLGWPQWYSYHVEWKRESEHRVIAA